MQFVFVASPVSTQQLRRKSKDLLARNQDNASEWSDMSTHRLSCFVNENSLCKCNKASWSSTKRTSLSFHRMYLVLAVI